MVFTRARVAIFIDGCFWHGCPDHWRLARSNREFWRTKVEGNRARDRDTDDRLRAAGWKVMRFWEHEEPVVVVSAIAEAVADALRPD